MISCKAGTPACKGGPNNDYSVCTTWVSDDTSYRYLLHVFRARLDYPALKAKVKELAAEWQAGQVLVEESGTAIGLLDELKHEVCGITGVKPLRDKASRLAIVSAQFEARQVIFPANAPWLGDLEAELLAFPGGLHDDQVDSVSQALRNLSDNMAIWAKIGRQPYDVALVHRFAMMRLAGRYW